MIQYGIDPRDTRYNFYSYDKYIRNKELGNNALVIVDECHNMRTQMVVNEFENPDTGNKEVDVKTNKKGYIIKTYGTDKAHKILLLTATPFVNILYDIENLLAMIEQRPPHNPATFFTIISSDTLIYDYFKHKISHYEKSHTSEFFPERREKLIPLYLNDEDERDYNGIINSHQKNQKSFHIGARQLSNTFKNEDNYKMVFIVNEIKKNNTSKNIVYTGFQNTGVKLLTKLLDYNNIEYKIISGTKNSNEKNEAKQYYNHYNVKDSDDILEKDKHYINNKYRVLIITKAGAEGVDTKNTSNIFLIDLTWNEAISEQIIARAIRFKSHHSLPKAQRFVNVYRLLLVKKSDKEILDKILDPTFNDYEIISKKFKEDRKQQNLILSQMERGATVKDAQQIFSDNEKVKYSQLKTKEERRLYISKLDFSRYKTKSDTLKILNSSIPSNDLYIFILSKTKQKLINDLIKKFDTFQNFELETYKPQLTNQLYTIYNNHFKSKKSFNIDIDLIRNKLLNEQDDKLNNYVNSKQYNTLHNKIQKRLKNKLEKGKIKQYNQFFTSPDIVDQLIDYSGFLNEKNECICLEPSAGYGAIVEGLIRTQKLFRCDLVEIDEENRIVLKKLVETAPNILELQQTKDYLKYIPSKNYDYIFLNPPFHLKKNNYLKRDVYDIEFVKRAYAMLKIGGVLCAITSVKFINDKWYKAHNYEYKTMKIKWKGIKKASLSSISNLEIAFIKIKKLNNDEDKELIEIQDIFKDDLIQHSINLRNEIDNINDTVDIKPIYNEII